MFSLQECPSAYGGSPCSGVSRATSGPKQTWWARVVPSKSPPLRRRAGPLEGCSRLQGPPTRATWGRAAHSSPRWNGRPRLRCLRNYHRGTRRPRDRPAWTVLRLPSSLDGAMRGGRRVPASRNHGTIRSTKDRDHRGRLDHLLELKVGFLSKSER